MKDKLIFIISIVLVIAGVSYLGFTAYKFFTRDSGSNQSNNQVEQNADSSQNLELASASNQEILAENSPLGQEVSINASLKNNSENNVSTQFEGRTYSIDELFTFPNIDTDLPIDSKPVEVLVEPNASQNISYANTASSCGTFYTALADKDYWTKGRGLVTYGYFTVACDSSTAGSTTNTNTQTGSSQESPLQKAAREAQQGTVAGTSTTKGGINSTNQGDQTVSQLPKSGPAETLMAFGVLSILAAFAYRLKKITL